MKRSVLILGAFLACTALASHARADEFHLKDGSQIEGTIVGYTDNSFKVETSYGFAMIRKDTIAEIVPGDSKKSAPGKTAVAAPPKPEAAPLTSPSSAGGPTAPPAPALKPASRTEALAAPVPPHSAALASKPLPPPALKDASLPPVPAEIASPAPEPPTVREHLGSNLYINDTFGFQMYSPPGWALLPDASKALPDAITAVGSSDETALLVIGRDIAHDSLDAHAAGTDRILRGLYENYRVESSERLTVSGLPAVEQHSRGVADGREWSVVVVTFGRGTDMFTILGMVYENSDLIQIRENVLAKMISSLRFDATH